MKTTKWILFAALVWMLAACNSNSPVNPSQKTSGKIVGTIGCFDESDERIPDAYRKAVVIETADKDSLLSFNMDIEALDLRIPYGTYSIAPVTIPYEFYYQILSVSDPDYVHIALIVEDAMHQPCAVPAKQVKITRIQ